jgi:hypothetical protein
MKYEVIIPHGVYEELNEAALYFESKQIDLGVKFLLDWEASMKLLKATPLHYQKKHKEFRSIKLSNFPYLLVFEIEGKKIVVYRLAHARKNPKKIFKK